MTTKTKTEAVSLEQSAKVAQIKGLMDDLKAKAQELGLVIVANVSEAKEAVSQKLDEAKDEWAAEAAENPDDARRKIRLIWAVIGAAAGFVLGAAAGYLFAVL
ncbi:hypothetical protein [Sutterella wadsworthensis]|uniref:hypothetical protein n=1 Tax=Sutterella wadsworthensis TaxID=40545 RepID=UPI003AF18912